MALSKNSGRELESIDDKSSLQELLRLHEPSQDVFVKEFDFYFERLVHVGENVAELLMKAADHLDAMNVQHADEMAKIQRQNDHQKQELMNKIARQTEVIEQLSNENRVLNYANDKQNDILNGIGARKFNALRLLLIQMI